MGRVFFAAILGAIVVFAWGFVSWGVLDLYGFAFKNMPNDAVIVPAINAAVTNEGAYYFPTKPETKDMTADQKKAAEADWTVRHKSGPTGMLLYTANGCDPMHWTTMLRGFLFNFAAAFAMAALMYGLRLRTTSFRLAFALLMVSFAMMITHAQQWNWFHTPDTYTMALVADAFAGWILGGGTIAMLVRPSSVPAPPA